jgi:hypothetical protein
MIVYGALAMLSYRIFLHRYTACEKILHNLSRIVGRGTPGEAKLCATFLKRKSGLYRHDLIDLPQKL